MVKEMIMLQRAMDATGANSIDAFVKASANQIAPLRARELAGFDGSPEAIQREVEEAVAGPQMTDFLIKELKVLQALTPDLPLDVEKIQEKAKDLFGKMSAQDGSNIKVAERALQKNGQAVETALEKGKWVDAFKAKQQQLLNHLILKETHVFAKEKKSFEREAGRIARHKSLPNVPQPWMNLAAFVPSRLRLSRSAGTTRGRTSRDIQLR